MIPIALLSWLLAVPISRGQELPGGQAGGWSAPEKPAAQPLDPEVDRILTRLESRDIRDLNAKLTWRKEDDSLPPTVVVKQGELWFQQAEPVARFKIRIDRTMSAGRMDKNENTFIFDGQVLTEISSVSKTVSRKEIRKPDDRSNPYRLGEGAFPLPFGQKKDAILREFIVERVSPDDGDPPQTDHLRLTPRHDTPISGKYRRVEFWLKQDGELRGLPVRVRTEKNPSGGDAEFITMDFSDVKLGQAFSAAVFSYTKPPGYTEQYEPLKK